VAALDALEAKLKRAQKEVATQSGRYEGIAFSILHGAYLCVFLSELVDGRKRRNDSHNERIALKTTF